MTDEEKLKKERAKTRKLRKEIKELKQDLEDFKEKAKNNYEYAEKMGKDMNKIQEKSLDSRKFTKDMVQTVADHLDQTELMVQMTRKALQFVLTQDPNTKERIKVDKEEE